MMNIMNGLSVTFEREWRLEPSFLTLDFYMPDLRKGIECHGRILGRLNREQLESTNSKKRELLAVVCIETL